MTLRSVAATAAVAAILAGLSGCGSEKKPPPSEPRAQSVAMPARSADPSPAAGAGGACQLLDFFAVEQFVGVHFDVAAAAQRDSTATCVLQRSGASYPDLTLAVTPAAVPASAFTATGTPPGGTALTGLGQAAYQLLRPAAPDQAGPGPAVEIGWLTRTNQVIVLRYRLEPTAQQGQAESLAPAMVDLAKFLDPA